MDIQAFAMEPFRSNCYLLFQGKAAVVIDPGGDPGPVVDALGARGLTLEAILLTHLHYDHIAGAPRLAKEVGAPIWASNLDVYLHELDIGGKGLNGLPPVAPFVFEHVEPGRLRLFGLPCLALPTPGHTPGSLSYFFPWADAVFSGDALFHRAVGRTDWAGGDGPTLLASIRTRLFTLPDETGVFPGHGPPTTVGEEKRENPYFKEDREKA